MSIFPKFNLSKRQLIHEQFLDAIDTALTNLEKNEKDFSTDWIAWKCVAQTKTRVFQSPFLGCGGKRRNAGGFWQFAENYGKLENPEQQFDFQRMSFERYQDFAFYTAGNWYDGKKVPLLVAEVESNPKELLGELAGLLTIRAALKYLFIKPMSENATLQKLQEYCENVDNEITDFPNTSIYVFEIPDKSSAPSTWQKFVAHTSLEQTGIRFEAIK